MSVRQRMGDQTGRARLAREARFVQRPFRVLTPWIGFAEIPSPRGDWGWGSVWDVLEGVVVELRAKARNGAAGDSLGFHLPRFFAPSCAFWS